MKKAMLFPALCGFALSAIAASAPLIAQQSAKAAGPAGLQVDNLKTPLGIDDPAPHFSWQLEDPSLGAKQTAYEVQVASSAERLAAGKADVWDSGRVESDSSISIPYAGPALQPSTRYFWSVKLWNAEVKPYSPSETSWWETGLMKQDAWSAQWIGYEIPEEATVRQAPAVWITNPDAKTSALGSGPEQRFDYRIAIQLSKPIKFAALYVTGQDTVSAWINGEKVLNEDPLPPWKQMPWKKFVRTEVTTKVSSGANTIAIEALHYVVNPNGMATDDAPPVIATLVVEYADGSWASYSSGANWKTAIHADAGWQEKNFDDAGWKWAIFWNPVSGRRSETLGHPWIPDSVKALRHNFTVAAPIKSARLYATALGAYELLLNDKRVGDQVLAPGWTDYRERLVYQTYDVTAQVTPGENVIVAQLAPGWYETPLEWFQQPNNYGDTPPALRAQLRIEHEDGSVEWVATDGTWLANTSGILRSELYDGETQDLRQLPTAWNGEGVGAEK